MTSNFPIVGGTEEEFKATNPGNRYHDVWTEIIIQAPPAVVRAVCLDFQSRASWDPAVTHIEVIRGQADDLSTKPALKLAFEFALDGKETKIPFRPLIMKNDEGCLLWGLNLLGGLFYKMDHAHIFEPIDGGKATRLVNYERFGGFLKYTMDYSNWKECFKASNVAIKKMAEEKANSDN